MKYKLHKLNYNGINFSYFKKDINAKQTILFIHGLGGSTDSFRKLFEEENLNFNIIALNLPGSVNGFPTTRKLCIEYFIEYTNIFLNQFIKRKVILFGHSLGGGIVSALSDHHKVEKVIYLATIHPFIVKSKLWNILYNFYYSNSNWKKIKNAIIETSYNFYKNNIAKEEEKEIMEVMLNKELPENGIVVTNLFNKHFVENTLNNNYIKSLKKNPIFMIGSNDLVIESKHFIDYVKNELKKEVILIKNGVHSPLAYNYEETFKILNNLFTFKKRWFWQRNIMYDKNSFYYKSA